MFDARLQTSRFTNDRQRRRYFSKQRLRTIAVIFLTHHQRQTKAPLKLHARFDGRDHRFNHRNTIDFCCVFFLDITPERNRIDMSNQHQLWRSWPQFDQNICPSDITWRRRNSLHPIHNARAIQRFSENFDNRFLRIRRTVLIHSIDQQSTKTRTIDALQHGIKGFHLFFLALRILSTSSERNLCLLA